MLLVIWPITFGCTYARAGKWSKGSELLETFPLMLVLMRVLATISGHIAGMEHARKHVDATVKQIRAANSSHLRRQVRMRLFSPARRGRIVHTHFQLPARAPTHPHTLKATRTILKLLLASRTSLKVTVT